MVESLSIQKNRDVFPATQEREKRLAFYSFFIRPTVPLQEAFSHFFSRKRQIFGQEFGA
jgi:hypothetical protein